MHCIVRLIILILTIFERCITVYLYNVCIMYNVYNIIVTTETTEVAERIITTRIGRKECAFLLGFVCIIAGQHYIVYNKIYYKYDYELMYDFRVETQISWFRLTVTVDKPYNTVLNLYHILLTHFCFFTKFFFPNLSIDGLHVI